MFNVFQKKIMGYEESFYTPGGQREFKWNKIEGPLNFALKGEVVTVQQIAREELNKLEVGTHLKNDMKRALGSLELFRNNQQPIATLLAHAINSIDQVPVLRVYNQFSNQHRPFNEPPINETYVGIQYVLGATKVYPIV